MMVILKVSLILNYATNLINNAFSFFVINLVLCHFPIEFSMITKFINMS